MAAELSPARAKAHKALPATPLLGAANAQQAQRLALIEESHQRCAALGLSRIERPDYVPLMRGDLAVARERNQRLSNRAAPVMEMLLEQILNTNSMIVLTDAQGTVLHTVGDDEFLQRADKVALSPGANWAEHSKGTNAIGTTLFAETPTLVHAAEHFMHANSFLTCSAAPIFDPRGNMLGVLDVTGDHRSYHQHTMGLVRMSARMIENHWLTDDYTDRLRLHFHTRAEFIGTLLEGIVVVGPDGRLLGANRSALDQLGLSMAAVRGHDLASLFGTSTGAVFDHLRSPLALPMPLHLPDGRLLHVSARFSGPSAVMLRGLHEAGATAEAAVTAPDTPIATVGSGPAMAAAGPTGLSRLLTGDPQIEALVGKLRRVLDRDITVLLIGETGTGKASLARGMHQESARAAQAFVAVNCASVPATQIEAELFGCDGGYADGAAREGHPGRIVQAHRGTLFLDEIGDLPAGAQARLLQVLQARCVTPLGSHRQIPVDIALIGATRQRLRDRVDRGEFREDLFYLLDGLAVKLPALCDRSDLPAIAQRMLQAVCPHGAPEINPAALTLLARHAWPGNLRQLANLLRTAAAMAAGDSEITTAHLPDDFLDALQLPAAAVSAAVGQTTAPSSVAPAQRTLQQAEVAMIRQVLDEVGGNISAASKRLGISRNKVYRSLRWSQPGSGAA